MSKVKYTVNLGVQDYKRRAEAEADVKRPGKFQGEPRYVPYFWQEYLDGGADEDDGDILKFRLVAKDKALFPELKRRKTVRIRETNDGFVVES